MIFVSNMNWLEESQWFFRFLIFFCNFLLGCWSLSNQVKSNQHLLTIDCQNSVPFAFSQEKNRKSRVHLQFLFLHKSIRQWKRTWNLMMEVQLTWKLRFEIQGKCNSNSIPSNKEWSLVPVKMDLEIVGEKGKLYTNNFMAPHMQIFHSWVVSHESIFPTLIEQSYRWIEWNIEKWEIFWRINVLLSIEGDLADEFQTRRFQISLPARLSQKNCEVVPSVSLIQIKQFWIWE